MAQRVLIVDDEPKIAHGLAAYFRQAGFTVLIAHDGRAALDLAQREMPDVIVLDLMLPGIDGINVCRTLRRTSTVPILMLTARVDEADIIGGLEIGADDYITKPFSPRQVLARAQAVLRRSAVMPPTSAVVRNGSLLLDPVAHHVTRDGHTIDLTPTEFTLLEALLRHAGQPLTRTQLIDALANDDAPVFDRTIDAHIKNLRRKVEPDPANPRYIVTVFGVGYKCVEA